MQFGIFDHMEQRDLTGGELGALYEQRLQMLEYADAAGFARYHKAEHHFTTLDAAPSAMVFLAAASQRTKRIRLGSLVSLLPFYHPVRFVEEVCALDHLSGGRLDVGIGKGISPIEHRLWGNPDAEAVARTAEAIDIVRKGLTARQLTHTGAFHKFEALPMLLTPRQMPHPPLWYPGNVEFAGIASPQHSRWRSGCRSARAGGPVPRTRRQRERGLEPGCCVAGDRCHSTHLRGTHPRSRTRASANCVEAIRRESRQPVAGSRNGARVFAKP